MSVERCRILDGNPVMVIEKAHWNRLLDKGDNYKFLI